MTEVNRPLSDQAWKYYDSSQKIAWKTGTSFGNKDAWAIGATSKYVVGVWVGNSDGEGRPDVTGVGSAAPLLFRIFDVLPKSDWFLEPYEDLVEENVCEKSGYLALPICRKVKKRISKNGVRAKSCPYHQLIQLEVTENYRVNATCYPTNQMKTKIWFVLPPLLAYFYKQKNPDYIKLPNYKEECSTTEKNVIDFIFPVKYTSKLSLTKGNDGELNPIILKLTHTNPDTKIFWYLDGEFIKETFDYHEIPIKPEAGVHTITVIDDRGNEEKRILTIQ